MGNTAGALAPRLSTSEEFDTVVLAGNLAELRRVRGIVEGRVISGGEVAKGAGLSEAAYRGYERSFKDISPSYENMWRIADYYGVSLDEIGGRPWPPED